MAELEQENGGKKSLKKLIIIIVGAVILLAAGGGATFFLMKQSTTTEEHKDEDHESAVPVEKIYFDMATPVVVAFPKGSAAKNGRITISMLVEGAETLAALKKNEPMIRNNLLMLIGAQDSGALNTREGKEALRKAMLDDVNAVLEKVAAKGQVQEIFFTSFITQ